MRRGGEGARGKATAAAKDTCIRVLGYRDRLCQERTRDAYFFQRLRHLVHLAGASLGRGLGLLHLRLGFLGRGLGIHHLGLGLLHRGLGLLRRGLGLRVGG